MTECSGILVQNHESHIVLFKLYNDGGIDCNPVVCFSLRIFNNMHVSLWVNELEMLSQELQWVLSHTNSTLILWCQLMELLKRYSEDIPEVALDIALTLSLRKNGATVSITFSNWWRNGATVDESYFLLSCSMTS